MSNDNGSVTVEGFGAIHCLDCEVIVAFFPAEVVMDEESDDLQLYCRSCAKASKTGGQ